MRLGTILLWPPGGRTQLEANARTAEDLGFTTVGVGDSPNRYRDWVSTLSEVARATDRASIGPVVSSPHLRHPVAAVSALAAADELSSGRTFFGIGTGGSAATAVGRTRASVGELRTYIEAVRCLMRREATEWLGSSVPVMESATRVPIIVSAYGPATRRLAGALADGVILAVGASPSLIARFREEVATGAREAGRSPDEVEIWAMARVAVRSTREEALADVKANLASAGAFGLRSPVQMETVPREHRGPLKELQRRYDPSQHVAWDGPNARLVDELGLGDFLVARFGVVGNADDCRRQLSALSEAGVERLIAPAVDRDPAGMLRRLADAGRSLLETGDLR